MQPRSLRVMPDSDVTNITESMANAGRTSGAGVVSGASLGQRSASKPEVWESGLSRSRRTQRRKSRPTSSDEPARQWAIVAALTGGAGVLKHNERADGHMSMCRSDMSMAAHLRGHRSWRRRKRSYEIDSEGSVSCGGERAANATRVFTRGYGRQWFSGEVGSMDWRRCTPEWSHRRRHHRGLRSSEAKAE